MNLPSQPMTVVRLQVDAFKRLRAAHLTPSPTGLIPVRGKNGAGKSSLIESMMAALLGRKAAPELPIAESEFGADVVLDLGQLVVRRHWKRGSDGKAKTTLSVQGADGSELKSPQAILDALVGEFADPVAFLGLRADEQVKTALAAVGLGQEVARLERLQEEAYERRRNLGRDADRLTKAAAAMEAEMLESWPAPPDGATAGELVVKLSRAKDHNAAIDRTRENIATLETRGRQLQEEIESALRTVDRLKAEQERVRQDWTAIAAERAELGRPVDVKPIEDAIGAHEAAARYAGKRELFEQTQREAHEARDMHEASERELAGIRATMRTLLSETAFPMPGVSYDPDEKRLTVNGIPFSQASQGERLKLAAMVAMAGSPSIRVMFAREGSLLDDDSKRQLAEIAESNGFQLWLEVVDSNREGAGVWIEDGEAFEVPSVAPPAMPE